MVTLMKKNMLRIWQKMMNKQTERERQKERARERERERDLNRHMRAKWGQALKYKKNNYQKNKKKRQRKPKEKKIRNSHACFKIKQRGRKRDKSPLDQKKQFNTYTVYEEEAMQRKHMCIPIIDSNIIQFFQYPAKTTTTTIPEVNNALARSTCN